MNHVISSIFTKYYNRYYRIYLSDIGPSLDARQDLKNVLLYMMAAMNNKSRDVIVENNVRMEDVLISAYKLCFRLDKLLDSLKFKSDLSSPSSSRKYFLKLATQIPDPYKSSFEKA